MKTRISQLVDGELEAGSADELIAQACRPGEAAETWRVYHLIGDALRGARPMSADFAARIAARIAEEPTVLAPGRVAPAPRAWFPMAAAASLAAVALVGWVAFGPQRDPATAQMAETRPAPVPVAPVAVAPVPIPPEANDYLLAHQAYSPRDSLQGMAPYVRSVSSER